MSFYCKLGIGKQSRSMFLELDATASKSPIQESPSSANLKPTTRQTPRQNSQVAIKTNLTSAYRNKFYAFRVIRNS